MVPEYNNYVNWRSELWDKFYMAAPKQLRQYVERYKIVKRV
jgi:hypothetical protein